VIPTLISHCRTLVQQAHQSAICLIPSRRFGIPLGVLDFVRLSLFGLSARCSTRAGAGNYFIKLAFRAGLGTLRGAGPKAAVLWVCNAGLDSGSSSPMGGDHRTFHHPLK